MEGNQLVGGNVPAGVQCPFWDECRIKEDVCNGRGCPTPTDHPFFCGAARAFDLVPPECPLCERSGEALAMEGHHRKTNRKDKKDTKKICQECHKTIHGLYANTQLRNPALGLDTLEGLLENEKFKKALGHIKKLAPGAYMRMRQSNGRRKRR